MKKNTESGDLGNGCILSDMGEV